MAQNIPEEIVKDLQSVSQLHQQAVCNYEKCKELAKAYLDFWSDLKI